MSSYRAGARARAIGLPVTVGVAVLLLAYFPFASQTGQRVLYLLFAWAVVVPVAVGLRHSGAAMRTPWRLVMVVVLVGAVVTSLRQVPALATVVMVPAAIAQTIASLLLLVAALMVVVRRGRDDYAGVIDATLAAVTLGGLLLSLVLVPRMQAIEQPLVLQISLALIVLVLSGTLGAIVRLIETDRSRLAALRWLLAAIALNLAGITLASTWPRPGAVTAATMMFMGAIVAVGIVGFDPNMARLADPGPAPRESIGPQRLALLGLALVAVPVAAGVRASLGNPIDGLILALSALIVAPLVMLRIGLLSAAGSRSERALRHLAARDPLTGMLNRRAFLDQTSAVLAAGESCVLVFCDLNDFKQVNDKLGHLAGDRLLAEVARRLKSCARETDLAGRYGGDEFVLLFRDSTAADVEPIVRRIRSALEVPLPGRDDNLVGVSIGAAVSDADQLSVEELIHLADEAMYSSKQKTQPELRPERLNLR